MPEQHNGNCRNCVGKTTHLLQTLGTAAAAAADDAATRNTFQILFLLR